MPFSEVKTTIIVTPGESPKRLDVFLANREPTYSRAALQRLIQHGKIQINNQLVKPGVKIKPGDCISVEIPRPEPLDIKPEAIPLDVLYEDADLVLINKHAGLVVHPAPGHWGGTLVNALLHHFQSPGGGLSTIGGKERPGLVHRLDKDTSGVMVVAKNDQAHRSLADQFKRHTITRVYEAFVCGTVKKGQGMVELAIGRDVKERKKFSSRTTNPKASITTYKVVERLRFKTTWVFLFPQTGRTHQLRVHLSSIDHPILGDTTYGGRKVKEVEGMRVPRVMLHAKTLGFLHPVSNQYLEMTAPMPMDMTQVYTFLSEKPQDVSC